MGLSVVVITKNEETNIGRCLESMSWADEIIMVDSQSTDRTVEIAQQYGAKIYSPEWRGFGPAKQAGLDHATQEWAFSIDADEAATPELAEEIRKIVREGGEHDGYIVKRRTNFLGRWIYHCGWYPDPVLRLFRREKGRFDEAVVHEKVKVDGAVGELQNELLHYSYPTIEHYLKKFNTYTTMGAQQAFGDGRRARWWDILLRPPVAFAKHYVSRQGFRDGMEGLIISVMSSAAVFVKYVKLRQLARR